MTHPDDWYCEHSYYQGNGCPACDVPAWMPEPESGPMLIIRDRSELNRWVADSWGYDDEPETLAQRQHAVAEWIRDRARRNGVRYGGNWGPLLDSLPEDWQDTNTAG